MAFLIDSPLLEEILITPVSSMSTTAPETAQISLITAPRDPITSRIFFCGIVMISTFGTFPLSSVLADGIASSMIARI